MIIYDFRGIGSRFVQRCVMAQGRRVDAEGGLRFIQRCVIEQGRRVIAEGGTITSGKSGLNSCNRQGPVQQNPVNNSGAVEGATRGCRWELNRMSSLMESPHKRDAAEGLGIAQATAGEAGA